MRPAAQPRADTCMNGGGEGSQRNFLRGGPLGGWRTHVFHSGRLRWNQQCVGKPESISLLGPEEGPD